MKMFVDTFVEFQDQSIDMNTNHVLVENEDKNNTVEVEELNTVLNNSLKKIVSMMMKKTTRFSTYRNSVGNAECSSIEVGRLKKLDEGKPR